MRSRRHGVIGESIENDDERRLGDRGYSSRGGDDMSEKHEDSQYGKSRLQHPARIHLLFIAPASPVWEPLVEAPRSEEVCPEGNRLVSSSCSCQQ